MRVTTNQKIIKRRGRLGMIASLSGIAVLALGMLASFRQQFVWVSLVALVLGFVLAQFGSYNLRRWGRSPRPDEVLAEGMKGFDDRYHFYAWSLPVPFVLLGPQGIYTLTTRDQTGQVTVTGSTWKSKMSLGRLLSIFAQEGLGNPTADAQGQAAKLDAWIKGKLPDMSV
jgi:membrane protein implicated in regulation of membrane protease activity